MLGADNRRVVKNPEETALKERIQQKDWLEKQEQWALMSCGGQAEARRNSKEQGQPVGLCAGSSGQSSSHSPLWNAWCGVCHPAQGTPPKDGWFELPVAKDALRACASLRKFGLYLSFLCWLMSVSAHGLGPAVSLAEGHVQGIAAHFIAWESVWITLVWGTQEWFDYLTEWAAVGQLAGIVHCQPECKAKNCLEHGIILLLFHEAFWEYSWVITFKGISSEPF